MRKHEAFVQELKDTQEERGMDDTILGHHFVTQPDYTDRHKEIAKVFVDDVEIGSEWTSIPWNFMKPITTSYWVWVDCASQGEAQGYINAARKLGLTDPKARVDEDPYADPLRYHIWVHDPVDVVALAIVLFEHKETHKSLLRQAKETKCQVPL